MSSIQKSEKIIELEDKIISLKRELLIRRSVYDRCISGLINDKEVKFSSLNDSQLEY